jgi:Flp pilus assembly protein TadB
VNGSLSAWPACAIGIVCGLGVLGLVEALTGPRRGAWHRWHRPESADGLSSDRAWYRVDFDWSALLLSVGVGIVCVVVTGWPVAGVVGAGAAYGLPRLLRQTSGAVSIARIEAVATWTEMLQGTLAASAGLGQAIMATADLSPAPIRPATEQLAAQLRAGSHPRDALLQFAESVADPCADRVVCSLLLAFTSRAQRLGDLLQALAESTREEVSLRLRIETSRASVRSGVRTVVVFSVVFAAGLAVLARSYLAPFGSAEGQVVLLAVGGLYAGGLTLMVTMARPPAPVRLLGDSVVLR